LEHPLVQQFQRAIDSPTAALSPASVRQYRAVARSFLIYLGEQHPAVGSLNQLRRHPHVLDWFVDLRSQNLVPAVYIARLLLMRCILQELAWDAQLPDLAHLIRREDIPRAPQRLPRALTPQQDQFIQQELLRRNDLPSNVLLLMRHTGMRIGECVDLAYDCLHNAGPDRWAIHVPLGKLKTERMVPVDSFVCQIVKSFIVCVSSVLSTHSRLTAGSWLALDTSRPLSSNSVLTFPMLSLPSVSPPASFRTNSGTHMPARWCARG
jgi:site-specific recombinase XerD